ncbi:MAG: hypothetical protein KatS3mg105_4607 [Gemmatales bacterium]|nr:MAG: hypothetical protein KatS3mg105_4607 [Gemmatales bacterium]
MPAEFLPPLLAERYIGGVRELPEIIGEIKAEVERRHQEHDADAGPIYLVIYNLQRFRDLRKAEDDFGFGMDDKPANPAQQFSEILRDGSTVGIHTIAWCDSLNNVQRTLDRQSLREFEMRVLFQMSAADSSILIDTPAASKLGLYRALFYHEETGQIEKFRPYSLPSESWLAEAARALSQK